MPTNQGKLIVLDGIDGSGKATQTRLLVQRFQRAGLSARSVAFPRYGEKSAALVKDYLNGKYGGPDQVDPYQASLFYALDRFDASFQIRQWLEAGQIVIADRYVSANMGHQGGKISNPLERKLFFDWLNRLEYEILNIPRPDLSIFLHLGYSSARRLIDERDSLNQDIHEKDHDHLKRAEQTFLQIARTDPNFAIIECAEQNRLCSPEEINGLIWQQLVSRGIVPERPAEERKMLVKRLLPSARTPERAEPDQPIFNLYAATRAAIPARQTAAVGTGLKIYLPKNYYGLIFDYPENLENKLIVNKIKINHKASSEIIISLTNLNHQPVTIAPGQVIARFVIASPDDYRGEEISSSCHFD